MKGLRRKYFALAATIVIALFIIFNFLSEPTIYSPNRKASLYFEYCILILQIILTLIIFQTKNNDRKNILTALTVAITILYIIFFVFSLIAG